MNAFLSWAWQIIKKTTKDYFAPLMWILRKQR